MQVTPQRAIQNPVALALEWERQLVADKTCTKADIARKHGLSRARVTQIMNLLDLPQPVLSHVSSLTARDDLKVFSEHRLNAILAIAGASARLAAYRRLSRLSA